MHTEADSMGHWLQQQQLLSKVDTNKAKYNTASMSDTLRLTEEAPTVVMNHIAE